MVCVFSINSGVNAQTRDCPTAALTSGDTVSGVLEAADCKVSDLLPGNTASALAKRFKLETAGKAVFTFTVTASGFAPGIAVFTAQGRMVGSNSAASGGTARVTANLPAGTFTIITFGSSPGSFEIKVSSEQPRTCATQDLPESGSLEGAFSESTCRLVDLTELSTSTANVAFFRYTMPRRGVLSIESSTAIARLGIALVTPSLNSFSGINRLTVSLLAGSQLVSVSSTEMGSFTLRTTLEEARTCNTTPIDIGVETPGKLETGGCRWLDIFYPSNDPTPARLYRFNVDSHTIAQIDETSAVIDSFLVLLSPSSVLASNDDVNSSTANSRILIHLVPGTYIAVASAYDETTLGEFTLKVSTEAPRSCDAPNLTSGAASSGQVPSEGCRVLDYIGLSTLTDLVAPFRFEATDTTMLALKAEGATASTLRVVTGEAVEVVRQAADRNGDLPVEFRMPAVPVTVLMTSTAAVKPSFRIAAQTRAVPSCATAALDVNGESENAITAAECRFSELVNYVPAQSSAQQYDVHVTSKGRHTLELESASFAPVLAVSSTKNELLGVTFAATPGKVSLTNPQLEPGDYKVLVTSATLTGAGAFKLRSTFVPAAGEPASASTARYLSDEAGKAVAVTQPSIGKTSRKADALEAPGLSWSGAYSSGNWRR